MFPYLNKQYEEEQADSQIVIDEMKSYKGIKLNINDRSCPLQFYSENQHNLPCLSEIYSIFFFSTASYVPSECVFSSEGILKNKLRFEGQSSYDRISFVLEVNLIRLLFTFFR